MQQQISVITLGVADLAASRRFYTQGFGWRPAFENDEILFYQMNGFVFGTWLKPALADDMQRAPTGGDAPFALAHNVAAQAEVAPPHGGFRGYVTDPDGHAWEIAWNPAWPIDAEGHVRFAA